MSQRNKVIGHILFVTVLVAGSFFQNCSKVKFAEETEALTDTGFMGLQKLHVNTSMPKKKSKNHPLTADDKRKNRDLSSQRILNEHVIGRVKRFKIISDRYRNRRRRFGLRFNLIAGIHNFELQN